MKNKESTLILDSMIDIQAGHVEIRRFKDNKKWISSDYKMSIPSDGKNQEQTVEKIKIAPFQISKFVVTNEIYDLVLGITDSINDNKNLPKVNITWFEAIEFCNEVSKFLGFNEYYKIDGSNISCNANSNGFRLPTDAQWQYACKANSKSFQYAHIDDIAWHDGNSNNQLHNISEKDSNQWGLYDMLGNVWEWCWDLYNEETYGNYRVFRGGSFAEKARVCGATTRRKSHPDFSIDDLGFRLARSI